MPVRYLLTIVLIHFRCRVMRLQIKTIIKTKVSALTKLINGLINNDDLLIEIQALNCREKSTVKDAVHEMQRKPTILQSGASVEKTCPLQDESSKCHTFAFRYVDI